MKRQEDYLFIKNVKGTVFADGSFMKHLQDIDIKYALP